MKCNTVIIKTTYKRKEGMKLSKQNKWLTTKFALAFGISQHKAKCTIVTYVQASIVCQNTWQQ